MFTEFIHALLYSPLPFLRYALLAGLAGSVAFGIVGTWVVTRRLTALAGAISHAVLGGIGLAAWLRGGCGVEWLSPMGGAVLAAVASAGIIAIAGIYAKEREDAVINAVWAIGMSAGLLFLGITPGYVDLQGYLLGNILLVTASDLYTVLALDAVVLALSIGFFQVILACSFDEEFAAMRGIRTKLVYFLMLLVTALTIVLFVNLIGIILVIALLTLPAAAAGQIVRRWSSMMSLGALFCMAFTVCGLAGSYAWNLPPGPVIVLLAALCYVLIVAVKYAAGRLKRGEAVLYYFRNKRGIKEHED
ncbi:MAG: metal ABC transporter permease [Victivallaceae bacterium]|nr:metal ABC transporter permease [Victivallaceae bacterium]